MASDVEIRDPIHVFVRLSGDEMCIIESPPFQRLRDVHHLALSYFVYPGATHTRFEHSLGVMELASRIFDVVTAAARESSEPLVREVVPSDAQLVYWRRALRAAALFHDVGHLPFSHASEHLLPEGWNHETLSRDLIMSEEMAVIWNQTTPPLRPADIANIALEPVDGSYVDPWIVLLREMITGDVFGADRMDYLLRDSYHAGVAYGHFDHHRLIDSLMILRPLAGDEMANGESVRLELGVSAGGLKVAEALLLARYAMYSQVYNHRTRKLYDIHLGDFLRGWLDGGQFRTDIDSHLALSDSTILGAIRSAAVDTSHRLHAEAQRIMNREHRFKEVCEPSPEELSENTYAGLLIEQALQEEFGCENIRSARSRTDVDTKIMRFPVLRRDGNVRHSDRLSDLINHVPPTRYEYIYANPDLADRALAMLQESKGEILERTFSQE